MYLRSKCSLCGTYSGTLKEATLVVKGVIKPGEGVCYDCRLSHNFLYVGEDGTVRMSKPHRPSVPSTFDDEVGG